MLFALAMKVIVTPACESNPGFKVSDNETSSVKAFMEDMTVIFEKRQDTVRVLTHRLLSLWGGERGARGHHFELQPLVCICLVCSGKFIILTQQCITQVTIVTTNSQQDP